MTGYLDTIQEQLVGASRELSARRRRRRRRGAVCAALVVLAAPPALAASGVWRPQLGDGRSPAPEIATDAPPADQLALLGVLRRPQTEADRSAASRYALQFVSGESVEGVRTGSVRLLAQSDQDRGIVLVPVARYVPHTPPLPADTPPEVRRAIERPPIDDALCVFQLDIDGAGTKCYSTADVRGGRVWMMLGHRALWLVPDKVATVRSEYDGEPPIDTAVRDNVALFTAPRVIAQRTTFLDADGKTVRVIEGERPPASAATYRLPSETLPPAPGATRSGAIRRIAISGTGRDARYELLIRQPRDHTQMTIVLERPACAGKRRVNGRGGGIQGEFSQVSVSPSLGDFNNAQWCPGLYRGLVRVSQGRTLGTFSFRIA